MAKLTGGDGDIRRNSLRGAFYVHEWRGKLVMRAWPRKRPGPKSAKQQAAMEWFRQAALATKYISPEDQISARELTRGTNALPRDLLMMALAGRLGTFKLTDGTWRRQLASLRDVTELLDTLSDVEGALAFRNGEYWWGLLPGSEGEVLTISPAGQPEWASGGGSASQNLTDLYASGTSSSAYASKGLYFTPLVDMNIYGAMPAFVPVSGATYKASLVTLSGFTIAEVLAQSAEWVAPDAASHQEFFDFGAGFQITAGQRAAVLLSRTDATDTSSAGVRASTDASISSWGTRLRTSRPKRRSRRIAATSAWRAKNVRSHPGWKKIGDSRRSRS